MKKARTGNFIYILEIVGQDIWYLFLLYFISVAGRLTFGSTCPNTIQLHKWSWQPFKTQWLDVLVTGESATSAANNKTIRDLASHCIFNMNANCQWLLQKVQLYGWTAETERRLKFFSIFLWFDNIYSDCSSCLESSFCRLKSNERGQIKTWLLF